MIERFEEVLTNPIVYVFLFPLTISLFYMFYLRIRLFFAKKNAHPAVVKVIEAVERKGHGKNYGYDVILEIKTEDEVLYEKIFLNHKVEINKEMNGLYEKRPNKNFLTVDKLYNYVSPYGEIIIIVFIALLLLLFMFA